MGVSAFLGYVGYYCMYFYFDVPRDDEGYWLTSLHYFDQHGNLYHNTFGQAGPLYYETWSFIFSAMGLHFGWDAGRAVSLVMWMAMSLLLGITIAVLTRRIMLGLLGEVVAFLVMFPLVAVPMEPVGLGHFLGIAVLFGLALFVRRIRRVGMVIIGASSMALLLTKVNIGVFALTALIATCALCWPSPRWVKSRRAIAVAGLVMLPIILMGQILGRPWVWEFFVLEVMYLACTLGALLLRKPPTQAFTPRDIGVGLMAALGVALLAAIGVLTNGTSLANFLYGAFFSQHGLGTKGVVSPPPLSRPDFVVAGGALAFVAGIVLYTRWSGQRPSWLSSTPFAYIRIAVGIWILVTIVGDPGATPHGLVVAPSVIIPVPGLAFLLAAPFVWVSAVGLGDAESDVSVFARTAICLMAVVGCLEAFPIAGAQLYWADLALVPAGLLCISDGLCILALWARHRTRRMRDLPVALAAVGVISTILTVGNTGSVLSEYRAGYYANIPVRLPGAARVRLPRSEVEELHIVTSFLIHNCSTYWSLPGLDSFYLFTGETPPTGLNLSQDWWDAFNPNQQGEILRTLRRTPRLCLVEDSLFSHEQYLGTHVDQTALIRYGEQNFVLAKTVGFYQLLVRGS